MYIYRYIYICIDRNSISFMLITQFSDYRYTFTFALTCIPMFYRKK